MMADRKACPKTHLAPSRETRARPRLLLAAGLTAWLVSCAPVGPDYQPPHQDMPTGWREASTADRIAISSEVLEHWWTLFNDPQLDALIRRATLANLDLQVAASRIVQARAEYNLARGTTLPTAEVAGQYDLSGRGRASPQDLFQVGFDTAWELDIFGGARRAVEAAQARYDAARENRNDVLISLQAEVARNYLELRASQQRLTTAENNVEAQRQSLEVAHGRLASGLGTGLDVSQSETLLAFNRAQLPALKQSIGQAVYRLDLLLGLPPGALSDELAERGSLPAPPVDLPRVLPSQLLRRRPDIRSAERQLAAATADIGVAVAQLFPKFSLNGLAGSQGGALGDLLKTSSLYWTVGPSVNWTLFSGGRIRAGIDLNRARRDEAQLNYEKTVLSALAEVEQALLGLHREAEVNSSLAAATNAARQAVTLASGRYRAGLSNMLDLLVSERALYQAEDQLIVSSQQLNLNLVALFKALGGGWPAPPNGFDGDQLTTLLSSSSTGDSKP